MPQKPPSPEPHLDEYDKIRALNEKISWLTAKFKLTRDFAPFADLAANPSNPAEVKNTIWARYLSHLGISSMGEVLDPLKEIEALRHFLPKEARPIFPHLLSYRPYFMTVIQCLDSVAEIPPPVLQDLCKAGPTAGSFAWTAPDMPDSKDLKFPGLLAQCKILGDGIENEIREAARLLSINCAVVMAVCPDLANFYLDSQKRTKIGA